MKRRRNRKITSTTKATVAAIVSVTSCSASRTDIDLSLTGVSTIDLGSCSRSAGRPARTRSTTATVLAPGWRSTASVIEFSPLNVAQVLSVSTLSVTLATSFSRTGLPPRSATISSPNSAALRNWRFACRVRVWRGPSSVPTGVLTLAARSATLNSSKPMLRAASASGCTRTRTAKRFWPKMLTWATPSMVDSVGEIRCSAKSCRSAGGIDGEVIEISSTGASAGLTLR